MPINLSKPLETKRLIIRQSTQEDIDYLVSNLNRDTLKKDFQLILDNEKSKMFYFSLVLRESEQILGFIKLQTFEKDAKLECYYELLSQYTENGYTIEALKIFFEYVFTTYEFAKIVAYVEQGNTRGWKAAERSGMKYMGEIFRSDANSKSMYFLINKKDFTNQFQF